MVAKKLKIGRDFNSFWSEVGVFCWLQGTDQNSVVAVRLEAKKL